MAENRRNTYVIPSSETEKHFMKLNTLKQVGGRSPRKPYSCDLEAPCPPQTESRGWSGCVHSTSYRAFAYRSHGDILTGCHHLSGTQILTQEGQGICSAPLGPIRVQPDKRSHVGQWNRIKDPDINPHSYEHLIFDKEVKIIQ